MRHIAVNAAKILIDTTMPYLELVSLYACELLSAFCLRVCYPASSFQRYAMVR